MKFNVSPNHKTYSMPLTIQNSIFFNEAPLLENFYEHELLEDYDYKCSPQYSLFSKITSNFKISRVSKVYNPQLYGMYLLFKEELKLGGGYIKEEMLYHATSPENAKSIASSNIDWRKTLRSRFGIGACFSPTPMYANKYAGSQGAFVICKVLMKRVEDVEVNYELEIPENTSYDTTSGNDGRVYVKYDDYNFYPEFIVYYFRK